MKPPPKPHPEQLEELDLERCPFCNSGGPLVSAMCSTAIRECWGFCSVCRATGPVQQTLEAAAEAWNRRARIGKETGK
jgi:hypothetical protein